MDRHGLIDDLSSCLLDVPVLPDHRAQWWADQFAERFVQDRWSDWWWQSLKCDVVALEYGDSDGLAEIERWAGADQVVLLVTDESPEPAGCFIATAEILCSAIRQVRAFEFVIFTLDLSRFVFDTHHNVLVFGPQETLDAVLFELSESG